MQLTLSKFHAKVKCSQIITSLCFKAHSEEHWLEGFSVHVCSIAIPLTRQLVVELPLVDDNCLPATGIVKVIFLYLQRGPWTWWNRPENIKFKVIYLFSQYLSAICYFLWLVHENTIVLQHFKWSFTGLNKHKHDHKFRNHNDCDKYGWNGLVSWLSLSPIK